MSDDRKRAANRRQGPFVEVMEWPFSCFPSNPISNHLCHIAPLLHCDRRKTRQRLPPLEDARGIPNDKERGMTGTVRSRLTLTRPARLTSAPSHLPAGEAVTPAVQITFFVGRYSLPIITHRRSRR